MCGDEVEPVGGVAVVLVEALLFGPEGGQIDGVGVVGVQQLAALFGENREPPGLVVAFGGADGEMVFHAAGEPVDLVDDDHVDVAVTFDPFQHRLQLRPVSGAGGLTAFGVLVDQRPSLRADPRDTRVALGGDGVALLGEVLSTCRADDTRR